MPFRMHAMYLVQPGNTSLCFSQVLGRFEAWGTDVVLIQNTLT